MSQDQNDGPTERDGRSFTGHTPGPWRAGLRDEDLPHSNESGEEICCLPHMAFDAVNVYALKRGSDWGPHNCELMEFEANCCLIAAAPELLAALKAIIAEHERVPFSHPEMTIFKDARAAIAKAERPVPRDGSSGPASTT